MTKNGAGGVTGHEDYRIESQQSTDPFKLYNCWLAPIACDIAACTYLYYLNSLGILESPSNPTDGELGDNNIVDLGYLGLVYKPNNWLVVWLPFFIFPYIGNHHPNWLSYFSEGFKPPTSKTWLFFSQRDSIDFRDALWDSRSSPESSLLFFTCFLTQVPTV